MEVPVYTIIINLEMTCYEIFNTTLGPKKSHNLFTNEKKAYTDYKDGIMMVVTSEQYCEHKKMRLLLNLQHCYLLQCDKHNKKSHTHKYKYEYTTAAKLKRQ
jgi:hypothetical protein